MVLATFPESAVWYIEARDRVGPFGYASEDPQSGGSGVLVCLEHLDDDGNALSPPKLRKYVLTCAHVVLKGGWGEPYHEILCWPSNNRYLRLPPGERAIGEPLQGAYQATISRHSPCGGRAVTNEDERIDANDWVLLEITGFPEIRTAACVRSWKEIRRDIALNVIGFPNGMGSASDLGTAPYVPSLGAVETNSAGPFTLGREAAPGTLALDGNAQTTYGMSGGGLFDAAGNFYGVHRAGYNNARKRISIAISYIRDFLSAYRKIRPAILDAPDNVRPRRIRSNKPRREPNRTDTSNESAEFEQFTELREALSGNGWVHVYGRPLSGKTRLLREIQNKPPARMAVTWVKPYTTDPKLHLASFLDNLETAFGLKLATNSATIDRISSCSDSGWARRSKRPLIIVDCCDTLFSACSPDERTALITLLRDSPASFLTASVEMSPNGEGKRLIRLEGLNPIQARALVGKLLATELKEHGEEIAEFVARKSDLRPGLLHNFVRAVNFSYQTSKGIPDLATVWAQLDDYRIEQLNQIDEELTLVLLIAETLVCVDSDVIEKVFLDSNRPTASGAAKKALQDLHSKEIAPLGTGWRTTILKTASRKHLPAVVDQLIFQWAAKEAQRLREWERLPKTYDEARKLWKPLYNAVRNVVFSDRQVAPDDPWKSWLAAARIVHHFGHWDVIKETLEKLRERGSTRARLEAQLEYVRLLSYSGNHNLAEIKARDLLRSCEEEGFDGLHARALLRLGQVQLATDKVAAHNSLRDAIEVNRVRDFLVGAGFLAELEIHNDDLDKARELLETANRLQDVVSQPWRRIQAHHYRLEATIALAHGQWKEAKDKYTRVAKMAGEWAVDQRLDGWALGGLALCELDGEKAIRHAQEAIEILSKLDSSFQQDIERSKNLIAFLKSPKRPTIFLLGSPAAGKTTQSRRLRRWFNTSVGIPSDTISIDDAQKLAFPKVTPPHPDYSYTEGGALSLHKRETQIPVAYQRLLTEVQERQARRKQIMVVEFAHPSATWVFGQLVSLIDGDNCVVLYLDAPPQTRSRRNEDRRDGPNFIPPNVVYDYASEPGELDQVGLPWNLIQSTGSERETFEQIEKIVTEHLSKWLG